MYFMPSLLVEDGGLIYFVEDYEELLMAIMTTGVYQEYLVNMPKVEDELSEALLVF